jgi:hypothetical protein
MKIFAMLFGGVGVLVAGLIGYALYLAWDVKQWDAKIDALCAANGGRDVATRVYETAVAPDTPEYFAETRPVRSLLIPERLEGRTLDARYPYVMETRVVETLHKRDPGVVKYTERIVRVSDRKVLGERFRYQRSGGGLPFPDPGTNHSCPIDSTAARVDVNVFVNHPRRDALDSK